MTSISKAQLAGDRNSALALLDTALAQGTSAHELDVEVIAAAQREIGRLWQENRISVADEHMATAISQFALAHLYRFMVRAPRIARRVVVAYVEGEQHELGPRIATDLLDAAGYGVSFLGANVPTDSLVASLRREPADLLALSASLEFNLPALRLAIARVRAGRASHPRCGSCWSRRARAASTTGRSRCSCAARADDGDVRGDARRRRGAADR